jgi:hypothetical protein
MVPIWAEWRRWLGGGPTLLLRSLHGSLSRVVLEHRRRNRRKIGLECRISLGRKSETWALPDGSLKERGRGVRPAKKGSENDSSSAVVSAVSACLSLSEVDKEGDFTSLTG